MKRNIKAKKPLPHEMLKVAEDAGWSCLKVIDGEVYGLCRMIFTIGLMCKCEENSYERRYCFETLLDAYTALEEWDGVRHPGVRWVKLKGKYEGQHANHRPDQINEDGSLMELDDD